jgi:hypothetical protein
MVSQIDGGENESTNNGEKKIEKDFFVTISQE